MAVYLGSEKVLLLGGGALDTSDATATADKVVSGYTFYADNQKLIGTLDWAENVYAIATVG